MKIDMKTFKQLMNGSHYYRDWDDRANAAFRHPSWSFTEGHYELFCTRMDRPHSRSHLFQLNFDENGVTLSAHEDDDKMFRLGEIKQIVEYVSDFYSRLFDNGFLVGDD